MPAARSTPRYAVLASGCCSSPCWRRAPYGRSCSRAALADLLVLVGIIWLATSLVAALTLTDATSAGGSGHMFELDGILIIGIPVALDLAHTAESRPLAGDLHAADLVVVGRGLPRLPRTRAITLRLARKDEYTEQHTRRVALRAVQVGEALGLSAESSARSRSAASSTTSASSRSRTRSSRNPARSTTTNTP